MSQRTQTRGNGREPDGIEDDELQYGHGPMSKEELEAKYPNRPINAYKTLPFRELLTGLFKPLNENKKKPAGPTSRAKQGPHGPKNLSPHEARRVIIERFISRWRNEVGNDFYPALRLIIPEKDRDRAMYGLKEKAIGRLLVKLLKIGKDSEDGFALLNWKLPGQTTASRLAGDFAGRCYEVLSKRPMRVGMGDMRIAEVNRLLDQLSLAQKEPEQLHIFQIFYNRMNAEELLWLIRIILRQMKVGASEKTFLELWHPDGEVLFNVSSSLRRVCWELTDPNVRLEGDETAISIMQCFQPQLAQFQMHSFQKMVDNMRTTPDDPEFWIEEKLDGERMQMHMIEDEETPGGRRFNFWSRKAKDYTYLYGSSLQDDNGAITRWLKDAFDPGVRNLILDGEMITWDPEADMMVPFGTLKTAALSEQRNPYAGNAPRPLFKVFDILYLNDVPLTRYTLRDRRRALAQSVQDVHRRMEKHTYTVATSVDAIEPLLRKVVAEASEGLVLKNPRSMYRLNSRNDDWMKVKPEYMTEFGESLDCVVIGGYYGSGHRGGRLSSFLCGLRVDQNQIEAGADPMKCYSFFKVGGGFRAEDYASIRHHTEGKWIEWDKKKPPTKYIELAGGALQHERPDVWIKPSDSVVFSVKAASVTPTETFRTGFTLRFPRFKSLRLDRSWDNALSIQEFVALKNKMEEEGEKEMTVDTKRRVTKRQKKEMTVAGNETITPYAAADLAIFEGMKFCVLSDAIVPPYKKKKGEIEAFIKSHGGQIFQSSTAEENILAIADKKVVQVASIMKRQDMCVIRPRWLWEAERQCKIQAQKGREIVLPPVEPAQVFYCKPELVQETERTVDRYGDSFARELDEQELRGLLKGMPKEEDDEEGMPVSEEDFLEELMRVGDDARNNTRSFLFGGKSICFADLDSGTEVAAMSEAQLELSFLRDKVNFGRGKVVDQTLATHVVVGGDQEKLYAIRQQISEMKIMPRLVTKEWIAQSWTEGTLLDEEGFAPGKGRKPDE